MFVAVLDYYSYSYNFLLLIFITIYCLVCFDYHIILLLLDFTGYVVDFDKVLLACFKERPYHYFEDLQTSTRIATT